MTRLWLPMGRRILLPVAFLAAVVLLTPMRLAVDALGLGGGVVGARGVGGSVWAGTFDELRMAGVPMGQVRASLSPLQLLLGRARIDFVRQEGEPAKGAITVSRNSIGVDDATASFALGAALAPLPVSSIDLTDLSFRFVDGACTRASGGARARLDGAVAGVALAQGLAGNAVCDGRAVRLPLAGQSGQERLDLRIDAGGGYTADLIAVEPSPDRVAGLTALGFAAVPGGYRLRATGRLE